jgi:predicted O-methyltransferase YrrM
MVNSLREKPVRNVIERLFAAAGRDDDVAAGLPAIAPDASARERADAMQELYLPISASGGELLYILARAARPRLVVEFGLSYGISTLYLAAAVTDNGSGRVVSTELNPVKAAQARASLDEAGVGGVVAILVGDARETLRGVAEPVDLVLLDGWKDLCLPVLRQLEPRLAPGAVVVADDTSMTSMADYLGYVRDPANGYVSVAFPVEDGMEVSCRP